MTHPLDIPSFLDRRAPTPATDPEAAGGAVKAASVSITDGDPPLFSLGAGRTRSRPHFSPKGR